MPDDVIVVEAKAQVGLRTVNGVHIEVGGTFAVDRSLVAATLAAVPERTVRALGRPPTREEIQRSARRGLIFGASLRIPVGGPGREPEPVQQDDGDTRPLTQLRRDELIAGAELLELDTSGVRRELIDRIQGEAERRGVSPAGPGLAAIRRIFEATPT